MSVAAAVRLGSEDPCAVFGLAFVLLLLAVDAVMSNASTFGDVAHAMSMLALMVLTERDVYETAVG